MAGNMRKFVNRRFLEMINLDLMKRLLARHEGKYTGFSADLLDQDEDAARDALRKLLIRPEDKYPEGLLADLRRIAELCNIQGLEIIQAQAERKRIDLFPDMQISDGAPETAHDPTCIAVRVFLDHPDLFEAAADHLAMLTAHYLDEYIGKERGVTVDLTDEKVEEFRTSIVDMLPNGYLGDYCRVGAYHYGDQINLVVSHGFTVSTVPVIEGQQERVSSVRYISHMVLRYSEYTGILLLDRIRKTHQDVLAELFASIILVRPGFFDAEDALDLYPLSLVELDVPSCVSNVTDYPFSENALVIRGAADLKMLGQAPVLLPPALRVKRSTGEIQWSNRSVILSPQLFRVFERLLEKAQSCDQVASVSCIEGTTSREARDLIRELRDAFKAAGFTDAESKAMIVTVRGRGYRLDVPASAIVIEG